jgi:hypothetical protein
MTPISRMALAVLLVAVAPGARADVALPPFYVAASKLPAEGKLGQVLKKEPVSTSIAGARAWRIAYLSSDVGERRTVSTENPDVRVVDLRRADLDAKAIRYVSLDQRQAVKDLTP